ncbi:hypothetical protein Nepgr_010464 [Nepenthes gracilis]|uniref:Uncharacterized protein n=1 Tax=Nepenthes gracilis TaxID=150966 RepID=A0AAD3XLD0_NEPGR|nr:hypothetical protein Nepgr_010464 [Nepenthes gracilis]
MRVEERRFWERERGADATGEPAMVGSTGEWGRQKQGEAERVDSPSCLSRPDLGAALGETLVSHVALVFLDVLAAVDKSQNVDIGHANEHLNSYQTYSTCLDQVTDAVSPKFFLLCHSKLEIPIRSFTSGMMTHIGKIFQSKPGKCDESVVSFFPEEKRAATQPSDPKHTNNSAEAISAYANPYRDCQERLLVFQLIRLLKEPVEFLEVDFRCLWDLVCFQVPSYLEGGVVT